MFLAYFGRFMVYISVRPESELLLWVSLVAVPFGLIIALRAHSRLPRNGLASLPMLYSSSTRRTVAARRASC